MGSLLKSTLNTRCIIKDDDRYIRSDVPHLLTEEEIDRLFSKNIRTLIDLRTPEEQIRKPCSLKDRTEFRYISLPVTGGNAVPSSPDAVALFYLKMYDGQMKNILKTILEAETGVMYFCSAGKDRTGWYLHC